MEASALILIELALVVGFLGFLVWQLVATRRSLEQDRAARREREARARAEGPED